MSQIAFGAEKKLRIKGGDLTYYSLEALEKSGVGNVRHLPFSLKILLEAVLRQIDGTTITEEDVERVVGWNSQKKYKEEVPFKPSRIVMQDFTGVPAVVDLAAMRDALIDLHSNPSLINPMIPVDLVIDHSVQVDQYGTVRALDHNTKMEFMRNRERYEFLRWGAEAFKGFRVVPPATGIVHQVNLEYLADVVHVRTVGGVPRAFPDTLVGTDSHTTMINGLGVLGWGVGGIEAEAALLGAPVSLVLPEVIGFKLTGRLSEGVTATDLVLVITELLRKYGVVGKFIEFFGPGVSALSLPDRATISNMTPEYGATVTFFPVDKETIQYLKFTGRTEKHSEIVEHYTKAQGIFRDDKTPDPLFTDVIELDMTTVEPSLAGPKRPQDRVSLAGVGETIRETIRKRKPAAGDRGAPVDLSGKTSGETAGGETSISIGSNEERQGEHMVRCVSIEVDDRMVDLCDGSVVISAITSCTNTSNPSVMVGAGLLAKKAVERGLRVPPYVKTSLAPGSRVVTRYLENSGLLGYLEALGYHLAGYGCTTCIGNSGPLHPVISRAIHEHDLTVASVLSGNRNFEGRIHSEVRANYLASPPLVVAYGIAGTVNIDLTAEPLGYDPNGTCVFLKEIWPTNEEIQRVIANHISPKLFKKEYSNVFTGNETWNRVRVTGEKVYSWDLASTYIKKPPFFEGMTRELPSLFPIRKARVLAVLGDTVTTDHISPAGSIPTESPAGKWLIKNGVKPDDFNTYGSRRGNHEVMMRGTFANIRIRNKLVPDREGGYTKFLPTSEVLPIYDAAMKYEGEKIPLIVLAGKEYGAGSSRDWAAKGTSLLGVRAVIAESFERIHRSNLIGMGVLPLQFQDGDNPEALGLDGTEAYNIEDVRKAGQDLAVTARAENGRETRFTVISRIDTSVEFDYYRNGGILQLMIRKLSASA
ncbi:MAG: aconitate hydratase [Spirochaetes bacterium DG_61]|nr:MAG: aconitate hydratase [Spirochaetes bacterium DG_61]